MARKSIDYWEERNTELMLQLEKKTEETIDDLIQIYKQATKNINKEIQNIYKNFAKDTRARKRNFIAVTKQKRDRNTL